MLMVASSIVGSLWFVNHINQKQYHQDMLGGWAQLAHNHLKANQFNLSSTSDVFGLTLQLDSLSNTSLGFIEKSRLLMGQKLIVKNANGFPGLFSFINRATRLGVVV